MGDIEFCQKCDLIVGSSCCVMSNFELSLWHPIMNSSDRLWGCNTKIIAKRGGHLCAPVPRDEIGRCGYIQELSFKQMETTIQEYRVLCESFPRNGQGVEVHCVDVGLEDPSKMKSLKGVSVYLQF